MLHSKIKVLIIAPVQRLYEGEAYGVTSKNEVGTFDVLEGHTSFISLIKEKVIVAKTPSDKVEFPINRGILTVKDNEVRVYVGL